MSSAFVLQLAIVLAALAWKGQRLRRDRKFVPASGVRWTVVIALIALALTLVLHVPPAQPNGPRGLLAHMIQLGQNVALLTTFLALQLLYLGYRPEEGRRYSGRREAQVVALIVATMAGLTAWAVANHDSLQYSQTGLHRSGVAIFFLLPTIYLLYAEGAQVVHGIRYAVQSRSQIRRAALGVTAGGMSMLFTATAIRGFITISTVAGYGFAVNLRELASALIGIGNPTVAIGLTLPVLGSRIHAIMSWRQARRLYRDLEALWTLVSWTYPELIRPGQPRHDTRGGENRLPTSKEPRPSIRFLATSRRTECRDGYNMLQTYVSNAHTVPPDERVSRAVAELSSTPMPANPALTPEGVDPDRRTAYLADTRQLVAVSRALATRDLSWCASAKELV